MNQDEMSGKLIEVDARSKSNTHRLDEVEGRQDNLDKLVSSVATLANEQEHINSDVKEIKSDVKELAGRPGKMWDGLVEGLLLTAAGLLVGYLFARMGLV